MPGSNSTEKLITLGIFLLLLVISFLIIEPFISAVLTALVLAYVFHPVHLKLSNLIKKPGVSAIVISLLAFIVLVGISLIVLQITAKQVLDFYTYSQSTDIIAPLKGALSRFIDPTLSSQISFFLDKALENATSFIITGISSLLMNLPFILLQLIVTFFVMFYFIKDGDTIIEYLQKILPFKEEIREKFFSRFTEITSGVIYGTIIVGLIQGIIAGIGFYLFGVEGAFLLMIMSIILSILPIGSWLIWFPVGISFVARGEINAGIGMLLFGFIIVSYVDNVIRPYFVERKTKMKQVIVLLGMLGGVTVFGLIGFIVGPIILDYLIIFLEFYRTGRLKDLLRIE